jgi:hypothetical protein
MDFREMWDTQLAFTQKFWGTRGGMPDWKDSKKLTPVVKDYVLHLIKEATEVLDEMSWRMHRMDAGEINMGNALEEVIDCQKYVLGLAQVMGYTQDEFMDMFARKSMVVEQRFEQERSLPQLRDEPCVLVDIDGVLSDYPRCYYDWLASQGISRRDYDTMDLVTRESCKRRYRMSGEKARQPVLAGARELLESTRNIGVRVILFTKRPYSKFYRIYPDTLEWLRANRLPYDAILWANEKGLEALQNFTHILLAIDDDDENMLLYKKAGIHAIKVTPPDGTASLAAGIQKILAEKLMVRP